MEANETTFHLDLQYDWCRRYQLTCYEEGQYYGQHIDSHLSDFFQDEGKVHDRKLSFSLQLTDPGEYNGGNLNLLNDLIRDPDSARKQGTMIIFPSFLAHQVDPVLEGTRFSLVGWYWGPTWR